MGRGVSAQLHHVNLEGDVYFINLHYSLMVIIISNGDCKML